MNQSFGFPQPCQPPSPFEQQVVRLLCTISKYAAEALDSEIVLLCDSANDNAPVIVRYQFTVQNSVATQILTDAWNLDGTKYTGSYSTLVSCSVGEGTGSILSEYFICDNGTQKIVQLCGTSCGSITVNYLLLDRTASTEPADWGLVALGACVPSPLEAPRGRQFTPITSSTSETTIITGDPVSFLDVYSLIITNTSDTDSSVTIRDSSGGNIAWVFEVPAHDTRGVAFPLESATEQTAFNNDWTAQCGTSVDSINVTALYRIRS